MPIKDTTKEPHPEWLFGRNPGAIEAQEEDGQRELANAQELPRRLGMGGDATTLYERIGIKVMEGIDPLFIKAQLPNGWKIVPTEHSMWSKLVDNLGRERASIFYKAAFYDRSVYISFRTRFKIEFVNYSEETMQSFSDTYERINRTPIFGKVLDGDKVIFETTHDAFSEKYDNRIHSRWWDKHEKFGKAKMEQCVRYLNARYPGWKNIYAYW